MSLTRSGREAGAWVYIDKATLRQALRQGKIDETTPPEDLEARRFALPGHTGRAQVLLVIRPIGV